MTGEASGRGSLSRPLNPRLGVLFLVLPGDPNPDPPDILLPNPKRSAELMEG